MRFFLRTLSEFGTIVIGLVIAILGYLQPNSILIIVLGVVITAIALVMLVDDVRSHCEDRDDFRRKITHEAMVVLDEIAPISNTHPVQFSDWSSKGEGFKVDVLGGKDYTLWKSFYDSIEERNEFLRTHEAFNLQDFRKFNRSCLNAFAKVFDEISWVSQSDLKTRFSNLLSKAKT